MTEEERENQRAKDRQRKAQKKLVMTDQEKNELRRRKTEVQARSRSLMTEDERNKMRAKDRERKAQKKLLLTEGERCSIRAKNREVKARSRSLMTEDQREIIKANDRRRKSKINDFDPHKETKKYYKMNEREFNRLYKQRIRRNRSDEEFEYDRIDLLLKMRKHRQSRSGKDHLLDNLKSKKGMRLMREEGRLIEYSERNSYRKKAIVVEEWLWYYYYKEGPKNREILAKKNPDVYKAIVEKEERERKLREEHEKREKELDEAGRWIYNPADDDYYWSNAEKPSYELQAVNDECQGHDGTEEDEENWKKQLEEWNRQEIEQLRKERQEQQEEERLERNRLAREKRNELKEKLLTPINFDADSEVCEYERLRERNIREREEAMRNSGWFSD